jgi:hypothetical protein
VRLFNETEDADVIQLRIIAIPRAQDAGLRAEAERDRPSGYSAQGARPSEII